MERGTAPALDDVAGRVERHDRRRRVAALADAVGAGLYVSASVAPGRRRRRRRAAPPRPRTARAAGRRTRCDRGCRVVAAMDDPDLVLLVDAEADRLAEDPVVGHRLWPERVDLEPWAPSRCRSACAAPLSRASPARCRAPTSSASKRPSNQNIPLHGILLIVGRPRRSVYDRLEGASKRHALMAKGQAYGRASQNALASAIRHWSRGVAALAALLALCGAPRPRRTRSRTTSRFRRS